MSPKVKNILYWITTLWLSLGMVSSGLVQLLHVDAEVEAMTKLGYPMYFLTILGIWKLLGVVAILAPKYPLVKEWAYAGFFFTMTGGLFSHIAIGDPIPMMFPAVLLIAFTVASWYLRPESKKIAFTK